MWTLNDGKSWVRTVLTPRSVVPRGDKERALFHRSSVIDLCLTLVKRSSCQWVRNIANKSQIQSWPEANKMDDAHTHSIAPTVPARRAALCSISSFYRGFPFLWAHLFFLVHLMNNDWFSVKAKESFFRCLNNAYFWHKVIASRFWDATFLPPWIYLWEYQQKHSLISTPTRTFHASPTLHYSYLANHCTRVANGVCTRLRWSSGKGQ